MRIGSTSAQVFVLYEAGVLLASKLFGANAYMMLTWVG